MERIDFNTDFDNDLQEAYTALLDIGYEGDKAADEIRDFSASSADEYLLLNDGIYSAVLTAIFHLWERDVKDLCKRMLRRYPVKLNDKSVTAQELYRYKFDKIKALLIFWGASDSIFQDINLLRLIVNTIKHSEGTSAAELLTNNFKYYCKLAMFCDLDICNIPNDNRIEILNIDDIKHFGKKVSTFWQELGKSIFI